MYLILKNFRCYEEKTFDFGEKGLVLLSGGSGKGKSTILMAIDFALFGNGSKIISHGKKSCTVELGFQKLKIIRKKGPNHLLVNDCYEDEAGEAIIKQVFGQIFNSVSYIPQNPKKTFVLLSPAERLDFLETFAFKDFDIVGLKEKAKNVIKEANENLLKITGSIRYAVNLLEQKAKPTNMPFFVPGIKKKENIEKYIQNEAIKLKNSTTILKNNEKKQKQNLDVIAKVEKLKLLYKEKEKTKLLLEKNKSELETEKQNVEKKDNTDILLSVLEMRLQNLLRYKETAILKQNYKENEEKLQKLISQEEEELNLRITNLQKELDDNPTEEEVQDQITYFTELIERKRELEKLEKEIVLFAKDKQADETYSEVKKKSLETRCQLDRLKLEKEKLKCPHCKGSVRFLSGTLTIFVNHEKEENRNETLLTIEQIQSQLATLSLEEKALLPKLENQKKYFSACKRKEEVLAEILEMEGDAETILDCKTQLQRYEDLLVQLKSFRKEKSDLLVKQRKKQYSSTIVNIQKQLDTDKKKLDQLHRQQENEEAENKDDEESLRQKISMKKQVNEQINFYDKLLKKNNIELECATLDLQNLEKELSEAPSLKSLYQEKQEIEEILEQHQNRKKDLEVFFEKVTDWRQNQKEVEEYEKMVADVDALKAQEIEQKRKYTASCEFKDNILEAESIFVSNVIDNINNNVQLYLEHFFPDHPITIRLTSFKETNKNETKPSIHLEIDYKGMEMDLSMLSGGELSRVILSFTLAFADLYNSPLILLDECTSSLDQDLTSSVLEGLQEHFGSKLCLLVAHQVVKGTFDKVITL